MPLVIDYELYNGGRLQQKVEAGEMPASSMYHDVVLAFCRRVEKEGYESAVYANYHMLTNYMDSTLLDDEAVIWAAQYGGACDVKGNYRYWQCAEDAAVGGISGNVDHDIWYIEPNRVYSTLAEGKKNAVSVGVCKIEFDADSYKLVDTIRCANLGTADITMWLEDDEGTKVPQDGAITTNSETAALVFTSAIY